MDGLRSEFLFEIRISTAPPILTGATPAGQRMLVSIAGGTFEGPRMRGTVLPTGNDAIMALPNGRLLLDVRTALRTEDGAAIYLSYKGVRNGPPEVIRRLGAGEAVDPASYYFRTVMMFETGDPRYDWLNDLVAVGIGDRTPGGPVYRVFAVL